jgi:hypothetical protein
MTNYNAILQALQQNDKDLVQAYTNTRSLHNTEGKLSIILSKLEHTTAALTLVLQKLAETEK